MIGILRCTDGTNCALYVGGDRTRIGFWYRSAPCPLFLKIATDEWVDVRVWRFGFTRKHVGGRW